MATKYIGHRGAKGEVFENTLKGIRYALEQGLDGVEIDIHLSKDNELMVIHDATVDRTTNGRGAVRDKTLNELKSLDAGEGEKIPTLEEVILLVKSYQGELFIELKAPGTEKKVIDLVLAHDYVQKSILKSFNHHWIKAAKTENESIKAQCLMYALPVIPIEIIKSADADGLSLSVTHLNEELVSLCHEENFLVTTWNANTVEDLKRFSHMGVDYVCTDFATLIKKL